MQQLSWSNLQRQLLAAERVHFSGAEVEVAIADVEHTNFETYINSASGRRAFYSFKVSSMGDRGMLMEYSLPLVTDLLHAMDGWDQMGEESGRHQN